MIKLKSLFRRGPSGPSSSKQAAAAAAASATAAQGNALQQQQQPPLKGASSVSSLDHHQQPHPTDAKQSKSQKHGSKDRLTSREKLCSSRESLDLKEASSKRQQQQPTQPHRQMPLVQQQPPQQPLQQQSTAGQQHSHHHHLGGNNNLLDAGGYAAMVVDPALTKELTDISFDGPREVSVDDDVPPLETSIVPVAAAGFVKCDVRWAYATIYRSIGHYGWPHVCNCSGVMSSPFEEWP